MHSSAQFYDDMWVQEEGSKFEKLWEMRHPDKVGLKNAAMRLAEDTMVVYNSFRSAGFDHNAAMCFADDFVIAQMKGGKHDR